MINSVGKDPCKGLGQTACKATGECDWGMLVCYGDAPKCARVDSEEACNELSYCHWTTEGHI
jgi:hypothetical protein